MTPAEAHIWIATFASALPNKSPDHAIMMADFAVRAMREKEPEMLAELDQALGCVQSVVSRETGAR